jgi:Terpene cyclase DEP1
MTTADQAPRASISASRKALCVVYGAIALAALISTWSQNTAYLHAAIARFFTDFLAGVKVTPASRSIACDILFFFLAAVIFMAIEARKHGISTVCASRQPGPRWSPTSTRRLGFIVAVAGHDGTSNAANEFVETSAAGRGGSALLLTGTPW